MDGEAKAFLIGLIIVCSTIAIMVSVSQYGDRWHVSQGYQWVPEVKGHWEKQR
jgi:uncharacterized membrane protein